MHQSHRQGYRQLPTPRLIQKPSAQPRVQKVQLRFAHRAFHPQEQPVVEVVRIVQAVFVENQRLAQGADLQQAMPVGAVARQARDFQPQDDPRPAQTHLRDEFLKPFPVGGVRPRLTQVAVDHVDALHRPAQRHGPLAQGILAFRAFRILKDLPHGRLPHVEISVTLQM